MEPRTLLQLEGDCREELDDQSTPPLWSQERLFQLLNEAVAEANLRARLIVDKRSGLTRIQLEPGVSEYRLHPSIIVIRRASLASQPSDRLIRTNSNALDAACARWREATGRPEYVLRETRNLLLVSPTPTAADTLQLEVWRNPTESELLEGEDDPTMAGVEAVWHSKLVHWACFRALSKRDVEAQSNADAERHYNLFEAAFGPRPTAAQLERLALDAVTGTTPHFF
jgi:hypothetical protein